MNIISKENTPEKDTYKVLKEDYLCICGCKLAAWKDVSGEGYNIHCSNTKSCNHTITEFYIGAQIPSWVIKRGHYEVPKSRNLQPDFAVIFAIYYPALKKIANAHGYCLAIHGSMKTDFDMILTPWIDEAKPTVDVIKAIAAEIGLERIDENIGYYRGSKPHGRVTYTIPFSGSWLDISVPVEIEADT